MIDVVNEVTSLRRIVLSICLLWILIESYTIASLDVYRANRDRIAGYAVAIAKSAVESRIAGKSSEVVSSRLPAIFMRKAAVFVTISKSGRRRGCKGSFEPVTNNLRDEIIRAAIGAATSDIRYRPVRANELKKLTYSVSIVGPLKRVRDAVSYPPARYGLLLRSASKS